MDGHQQRGGQQKAFLPLVLFRTWMPIAVKDQMRKDREWEDLCFQEKYIWLLNRCIILEICIIFILQDR